MDRERHPPQRSAGRAAMTRHRRQSCGHAAGANSQPRLLQARFTLGADPGRPRLLKGIYLLGLDRGTWDEDTDLPDDPAQVPPELLSVVVTVEPEGIRRRVG